MSSVGNKITSPFPCNIGTRQCDVGSPIIFNLFIKELSNLLIDSCPGVFITTDIWAINCLLHTDDVAHCAHTVFKLQQT